MVFRLIIFLFFIVLCVPVVFSVSVLVSSDGWAYPVSYNVSLINLTTISGSGGEVYDNRLNYTDSPAFLSVNISNRILFNNSGKYWSIGTGTADKGNFSIKSVLNTYEPFIIQYGAPSNRICIDHQGDVGIGTCTALNALSVYGAGTQRASVESTSGQASMQLLNNVNGQFFFYLPSSSRDAVILSNYNMNYTIATAGYRVAFEDYVEFQETTEFEKDIRISRTNYTLNASGYSVSLNKPVFCSIEYPKACMIFTNTGTEARVAINDTSNNEVMAFKLDGNISLLDIDDGVTWLNCGASSSAGGIVCS